MEPVHAALLAIVLTLGAGPGQTPPRTPVLVELFTSEGCSSCPAADALLARLVAEQPAASTEIIGLELHVDYWDRQGWKDPFSSSAFTKRQQEYGRALGVEDIYTPQLVVDGSAQMVGSDADAIRREIKAAAAKPHLPVNVSASNAGTAGVRLSIEAPPAPSGAERIDIMAALAEEGLVSRVLKGENGGRTLSHGAVVRRLENAGALRTEASLAEADWRITAAWNRSRLRAIVWLQGRSSRRIYGAAAATLPQP